jgi:hypothetical protein
MDIRDLADKQQPLDQRVTLALELAIAALNDVPSFRTHITGPENRPLSSYQLLPLLETTLRESKAAPAEGLNRGRSQPPRLEP